MKKAKPHTEVVETLTLEELCHFCQTDEAWVAELVEHGVLDPKGSTAQTWRFQGVSIARAKKARRLSRDLGINTAGVAMVLDLLQEREQILRRLARYEAL